MEEYKLIKWYPGLPERWKNEEIIVQRFALYYCEKGKPSGVLHPFESIEGNPEFWEKIEGCGKLITEDGIEVKVGDKVHWVNVNNEPKYLYPLFLGTYGIELLNNGSKVYKVFSTEKSAREYILMNSKTLSLNDVFKIYPQFKKKEPVDKRTVHAEQLINAVKNKI